MANRHLQFLRNNSVSETKTEAINKLKNIFNNPAIIMRDGEGAIERYFEYFTYNTAKGKFVRVNYNSGLTYTIAETIPEPFVPGTVYTARALVISNGQVFQAPDGAPASYTTLDSWTAITFDLNTNYKTVRSVLGVATLYNYDTADTTPEIAMTVIDNEDAIQELSDKINNLDFDDTPVAANVITKIVRDNGVVTITRSELANNDNTISITQVPSGAELVGSEDIVIDLKISTEDKILNKDGATAGNGLRANVTLHKITSSEIGTGSGQYNLPTNVKEAYVLRGNGTTQAYDLGDRIDIYKDSSLYDVYIGHIDDKLTNADDQGESPNTDITSGTGNDALCFIYLLTDGKYKLATFDIESILIENEFKDGLNVDATNHTVSVKVDNVSTEFGNAASGVNKPIKVKISDASGNIIQIIDTTNATNATVNSGATAYSATWLTGITQTPGTLNHTVYKVVVSDQDKYYIWNGSSYVEVSDGLYADLGNVVITGYVAPTYNTAGSSIEQVISANVIANGNSVSTAVNKLDNKLAAVTNAIIDAEYVITNTFSKVKSAMGASGADDDTNPGINNKFEYIPDPTTNYIDKASSLFDADKKLDAAIKSNADSIQTNVENIIKLQKSDRYYGVSNEAGGTAAKTVVGDNLGGFIYTNGERILVTFTNANTASNATLNVNGLGDKPIYYNGAPVAAGVIETGSTHLFVYEGSDGGKFILTGDMSDSSVEYLKDITQGDGISITDGTTSATIGSGAPFSATWLSGITQTSAVDSHIYKITTAGVYYGQFYKWNGTVYERTGLTKTVSTRLSTGQVAESGGSVTINSPSNLLMYDSTGALSILDTWDCGMYSYEN